jgi:hypothetical protein
MTSVKEDNVKRLRNQMYQAILNIAPQLYHYEDEYKLPASNTQNPYAQTTLVLLTKNEYELFIESILKLDFKEGEGFKDIKKEINNYLSDSGNTYMDLIYAENEIMGDLGEIKDYVYSEFYPPGWIFWMPPKIHDFWASITESGKYPKRISGAIAGMDGVANPKLLFSGVIMSYVFVENGQVLVIDILVTVEDMNRYSIKYSNIQPLEDFALGEELFPQNKMIYLGDNLKFEKFNPNYFINWTNNNPMEVK